MKRCLFLTLAVITLVVLMYGCAPDGQPTHTHSGGVATCTLPARCEVCNDFYGDKAAHVFSEATCTVPETCIYCQQTRGSTAEHNLSEPTCTTPATCADCGKVSGDVAPHTYGEWHTVTDATCTSDGEKYSLCSCGDMITESIHSTGHSFGEWTVTKEAECTSNGTKARTCSTCGETEESTVKAKGHSFGEWTVTLEPTYLELGTQERYCTCGASESKDIPRLSKLFEDDFSGSILDNSKWEKCPELDRQGGASKWDNDMSYLDGDGHLVIKAEWDEENNRVLCGGVRTEGLFAGGYGYYEASIKFSVAEGVWGAFWLQCGNINNVDGSAADGVEIDVVESIHNENGVFNSALHYDGYGNAHVQVHSGYLNTVNIYDGNFHTFAVERNAYGYIFYVDGIATWRVSASVCEPCPADGYIKLTIEAAEWASSGSSDCINALPIEMLVDYVRVYPENPYK